MSKAGNAFRKLSKMIDKLPKKCRYKGFKIVIVTVDAFISSNHRELSKLLDQFAENDRDRAIDIAMATIEAFMSVHDKSV